MARGAGRRMPSIAPALLLALPPARDKHEVHGAWFIVHGQGRQPCCPFIAIWREQGSMSHKPWTMNHEPRSTRIHGSSIKHYQARNAKDRAELFICELLPTSISEFRLATSTCSGSNRNLPLKEPAGESSGNLGRDPREPWGPALEPALQETEYTPPR